MTNGAKFLIPALALLCLAPFISSATGLVLGIAAALVIGNPYLAKTRKLTSSLLQISVMGMGFGMNLAVVGRVGFQGIGYTVIGISATFMLGLLYAKFFKVEAETSVLITCGTAICGGSAIAAVAPVIRAKHHDISVSLGVVFILNAFALIVLPSIGHALGLTESQFGLWCALAIHDTSSVVGAALQYGKQALEIATAVKLARALWIIPVAFLMGLIYARQQKPGEPKAQMKTPWFILGFIIAAALVTYEPSLQPIGHAIDTIAKRLLVVTLFLIGASLTRETVKTVGFRPLLLGLTLWVTVASATLAAIKLDWIHSL